MTNGCCDSAVKIQSASLISISLYNNIQFLLPGVRLVCSFAANYICNNKVATNICWFQIDVPTVCVLLPPLSQFSVLC